jgi:dTDP-4-dehydrorhamnose reductase
MSPVLVVGANGLVGSRLVTVLAAQGVSVAAAARGPARSSWPGITYTSIDLADAQRLEETVQAISPSAIINCAAMTDVDGCEREPAKAWAANVDGVATLARASKNVGAHLVHVSTDYVFDGAAGPYDFDAIPNPRGIYALTKHAGEAAVRALAAPGAWAIARTAVVYGWPPAGQKNFGSWLLDSLSKGQAVKLFADQWVSPSLASNVAQMLAEIAGRRLSGVWHTCGAEVVDRVTFGRRLCEVFGFDERLVTPSRMADVKLLSPRPAHSGLRVERTAATLAAKPLTLTEALAGFLAEYQRKKP